MIYNIIDKGRKYHIGIRLDRDYKEGEWVNITAFKNHIKREFKDEFADLKEFEKHL